MPRGRRSSLDTLKREIDHTVALLTSEIRRREDELARLVAQADLCRAAIDRRDVDRSSRSPRGRGAAPVKRSRSGGARVDWDEVLASVPATFGVANILEHPGARSRGRAQVYPALTRWQQAKKIEKVGTGRYRRL